MLLTSAKKDWGEYLEFWTRIVSTLTKQLKLYMLIISTLIFHHTNRTI